MWSYIPLIAIGGALIDFGINLIIAAASFWFVRVDSLRWMLMSLEQDFTRYPLSIYNKAVKLVLAFVVPFAFMNYFPATYFLGKSDGALNLNPAIGLLTPVIGVAIAALAYGLAHRFESLHGNRVLTASNICTCSRGARFTLGGCSALALFRASSACAAGAFACIPWRLAGIHCGARAHHGKRTAHHDVSRWRSVSDRIDDKSSHHGDRVSLDGRGKDHADNTGSD